VRIRTVFWLIGATVSKVPNAYRQPVMSNYGYESQPGISFGILILMLT